ncbi:GlxA family transcriptional regulator [Priestia megaterium]|uniref:GlxA family transcriptional regulator n=1 Tax=Priestia megaterium TaxID=1404 RepID=UPI0036DF4C0D
MPLQTCGLSAEDAGMPNPRQIVLAVYPGVELLDVTGPAEVFTAASRLIGAAGRGYDVRLASRDPGEVQTAAGVRLVADTIWTEVRPGVDTLLIPGAVRFGAQAAEAVVDTDLVSWVHAMAPRTRRIAAVCAGAHVLAACGLLDGQTATTHWCTAPALAKEHPEVIVDPDPIFVQAGRVWTCAGGSSAMDLALALVAEDHGQATALRIARWLVMYLKRPGGQSQFFAPIRSV